MNSQQFIAALLIGAWLVALGLFVLGVRRLFSRRQIERRVFATPEATSGSHRESYEDRGWLGRWLYLAGYRSRFASGSFIVLTLAATLLGLGLALILWSTGVIPRILDTLAAFPGGVGDILLPLIYLAPWLLAVALACLPWLFVRQVRRKRVERIEQDLPLTLELLAMLGESGLGFDAALDRVLQSQNPDRPLVRELRGFQLDTLAGRPRVECFRRLARRTEIAALNIFVSALVQAEQVGAGVAAVLRRQADDLRDRRREDAMALAMAMPVKRLFPMMICFLPGIFVATLGPTFYQFFQYAETIVQLRDYGPSP
jgi:pilus assembly protein TadC